MTQRIEYNRFQAAPVLYAPHQHLHMITVLRITADGKSSSAYQALVPSRTEIDSCVLGEIVSKGRRLSAEEALRIWPDAPGYRE